MSNHNEDDIPFAHLRRRSLAVRRANRRGRRISGDCRAPLPPGVNSDHQATVTPPLLEPTLIDLAGRPKQWHCIACGWRCDEPGNDYLCARCGAVRPFAGGAATMIQCRACKAWSLALACFCEWCGNKIWSS